MSRHTPVGTTFGTTSKPEVTPSFNKSVLSVSIISDKDKIDGHRISQFSDLKESPVSMRGDFKSNTLDKNSPKAQIVVSS